MAASNTPINTQVTWEKANDIKKYIWTALILSFAVLFAGCAKKEVIRAGTPFNDTERGEGVEFYNEITDPTSIETLKEISENAEEIDKPKELKGKPEIFYSLDRPNEGTSEIRRYVYFQDDGSSILYSDSAGGSTELSDAYFRLNENQTTELKKVLQ